MTKTWPRREWTKDIVDVKGQGGGGRWGSEEAHHGSLLLEVCLSGFVTLVAARHS